MLLPSLLAVIEVPHEQRVRCSAEGCGHSVYKRVHLVRLDGITRVYGSDCFGKLFGAFEIGRSQPKYSGTHGRVLTPEESALLTLNTEHLIESFEREHQAELARLEALQIANETRYDASAHSVQVQLTMPLAQPSAPTLRWSDAEAIARERLGQKYPGVNMDLPGFKGLLLMEIKSVIRENSG